MRMRDDRVDVICYLACGLMKQKTKGVIYIDDACPQFNVLSLRKDHTLWQILCWADLAHHRFGLTFSESYIQGVAKLVNTAIHSSTVRDRCVLNNQMLFYQTIEKLYHSSYHITWYCYRCKITTISATAHIKLLFSSFIWSLQFTLLICWQCDC